MNIAQVSVQLTVQAAAQVRRYVKTCLKALLVMSLLLGLSTSLRKVVVSELKDDTFYAVIWLDRDGDLISVDSRPSDALALALRLDCPIYVEETVLKSSKVAATVSEKVNNEELRRWLEGLNDEDLGRYKM